MSIAPHYNQLCSGIQKLLSDARQLSARAINTVITETYWEIGRRIVNFEQHGRNRASYGEEIIVRLSNDLSMRFGRGYGISQLKMMRQFYLAYPRLKKSQSLIGQSRLLSWTHYARLLRVQDKSAREFYGTETLRGGWSIRQLDRQIGSQFYERTLLSRNKVKMLQKGVHAKASDKVTPEEEIKNPYVLEFLGLKDEYSESDLEEALIRHLEDFLLELGGDFTFVGRQKRLRVGSAWYRIDLVFYHRRLRCLLLIDLKTDHLTHADAGQMHLYLNYAREHWMHPGENPPVGLILCAEKDTSVAHYSLEGLPNKVLASEYRMTLPKEKKLIHELNSTRKLLENRARIREKNV